MSVGVGGEGPEEGLLEDGHGERVGEDHESVRRVAERLHLEETDLVEASGIDVDGMSVGGSSFGESVVALCQRGRKREREKASGSKQLELRPEN